ncbi:hypothetical protein D187_003897 [Cystobacter fuscus DSM 2262]|uniref:Uncharacterized protein n=1 Tax=Cystobacter fuscus (strain ATCC 25194 / DSM 2262 / NBRC 100088 / M29) TaxID=1242864 RepID=S9P1S4_CYSF2|nr:hypothetical protein D187_003897 [Cystobacter fuscus DSM 2262]
MLPRLGTPARPTRVQVKNVIHETSEFNEFSIFQRLGGRG